MTYSCSDFASDVAEVLDSAGYNVEEGDEGYYWTFGPDVSEERYYDEPNQAWLSALEDLVRSYQRMQKALGNTLIKLDYDDASSFSIDVQDALDASLPGPIDDFLTQLRKMSQ